MSGYTFYKIPIPNQNGALASVSLHICSFVGVSKATEEVSVFVCACRSRSVQTCPLTTSVRVRTGMCFLLFHSAWNSNLKGPNSGTAEDPGVFCLNLALSQLTFPSTHLCLAQHKLFQMSSFLLSFFSAPPLLNHSPFAL